MTERVSAGIRPRGAGSANFVEQLHQFVVDDISDQIWIDAKVFVDNNVAKASNRRPGSVGVFLLEMRHNARPRHAYHPSAPRPSGSHGYRVCDCRSRHFITQERRCDDINPDIEKVAEFLAEPRHAQQLVAAPRSEIDQQVQVAVGSGVTTSYRAKQARIGGAITRQHLSNGAPLSFQISAKP